MKMYFDLDSLLPFSTSSNATLLSEEEHHAMSILANTTRKIDGGYETGLLWKPNSTLIPNSFGLAFSRLTTVEKKFKLDDDFKLWYKSKIEEYINKGFAYKLSPEEVITTNPTWYLPHFCVTNRNKNNKRRLVFDAAAKVV